MISFDDISSIHDSKIPDDTTPPLWSGCGPIGSCQHNAGETCKTVAYAGAVICVAPHVCHIL